MHIVPLDVTDDDQIAELLSIVKSSLVSTNCQLWGQLPANLLINDQNW